MKKRNISGRRRNREDWIMDISIYVISLLILFMTLYPFYFVFMLSFNEGIDSSMGGDLLVSKEVYAG